MKCHLSLLLLGICLLGAVRAQTFEKAFDGLFYNCDFPGNSMQITPEGKSLLAGKTNPVNGLSTITLKCFSSYGTLLWNKAYETGAYVNYHITLQASTDSGYLIAASGPYELRLIRINDFGERIWTRSLDTGPYEDRNPFTWMTSDGDLLVAGTTVQFSENSHRRGISLKKMDINGQILDESLITGGSDLTLLFIHALDNGEFILGGYSGFPYPEGSCLYIIKTDDHLNTLWAQEYTGISNLMNASVKSTKNNSYIVSGTYLAPATLKEQAFLMWIDDEGNIIWKKLQLAMKRAFGALQSYDNGFAVVGSTDKTGNGQEDVMILKTNIIGDSTWSNTLGGLYRDAGYGIQQTADSGYIVNGATRSFEQKLSYLIRTNRNGQVACRSDHSTFYSPEVRSVSVGRDSEKIRVCFTPGFGITEALLYKESPATLKYMWASGHEDPDSGIMYDTLSDPSIKSFRYQLRLINACGDTSLASEPHRTIFLSVYKGGGKTNNLIWNHYEGADIKTCIIKRGISGTSMAVIDSVPGSISNYSDPDPPDNENHYRVVAQFSGNNHPENENTSLSNIASPQASTHIHGSRAPCGKIKITPNPVVHSALIDFPNPDHFPFQALILDVSGRIVDQYSGLRKERFTFYKNNIKSGLYIITLRGNKTYQERLIIR